ncbi:MAG: GldG family protein [Planctomycetes bacterium]|nr:GldG family protein [Planctomycetota bacterium]
MTGSHRSLVATALVLVITLCSTFLVTQCAGDVARFDLTANNLFTLSDGTKQIIDGLQKPLTMQLYYSKSLVDRSGQDRLRELNNYYVYVRDLLRSYERYGKGKLKLEEYDPRGFSEAEQEADRLGVNRFPGGEDEGLYFGMAVTSEAGAKQVVKVFDAMRQSQVEYQVSEAIELATARKKTKVGVLSSLDVTGGNMTPMMRQMMQMQGQRVPEPWGNFEALQQSSYEVTDVKADAETIDAEFDYLVVVHPKNLADKTLFAIDQFVMRGGKLIAFVDPAALVADPAPSNPQNPYGGSDHDSSSNLDKLFAAWGARVQPGKFAGDLDLAQLQPTRRGGRQPMIGLLALGGADGAGVGDAVPIAKGVDSKIVVCFAGTVERTDAAVDGVELTPILTTTAAGNAFTADRFELTGMGGPDAEKLLAKFQPGVAPVTIAARLHGKLKSAFPEGLAKSDVEDGEKPKDGEQPKEGETPKPDDADSKTNLKECAEPNTVLVFADVDMLADSFSFQRFGPGLLYPASGNPAVFRNAIDYLAGSPALMSIRSRGNFDRRFGKVDQIEREADKATREQVSRINADKERFQQELQSLQSQANEQNVGLLRNDLKQKSDELQKQIREKERELFKVQREKSEAIESLGSRLRWLNVLGVPLVVLLVGAALWFVNVQKRLATKGGAA